MHQLVSLQFTTLYKCLATFGTNMNPRQMIKFLQDTGKLYLGPCVCRCFLMALLSLNILVQPL